jgi:ribosomal protein S18 acetylase RimI-like enzyme
MLIRNLKEEDLPSLADLYRQFWNEASSIDKMTKTFGRLSNNPNYIFLVAEQDKTAVGSAMGIVCEEHYCQCDPFMVIEDVIVDGPHRRQGIASALMTELERRATTSGCAYIIFVTEAERTEAQRFYASLGFKTMPTEDSRNP